MTGMMGLSAMGGGRMPDFSAIRDKLFAKGDADQSGGLSQAEFAELGKSMPGRNGVDNNDLFKTIDSSGDGSIDKDEMSRFGEKMRASMQSMMLSVQMQFGDMNTADPTKIFDQADSNSDGSVTKSEFSDAIVQKKNRQSSDAIEKLFEALDADRSGDVSKSEAEDFQATLADQMQTNRDSLASGSTNMLHTLKSAISSYSKMTRSTDTTQGLVSLFLSQKTA